MKSVAGWTNSLIFSSKPGVVSVFSCAKRKKGLIKAVNKRSMCRFIIRSKMSSLLVGLY